MPHNQVVPRTGGSKRGKRITLVVVVLSLLGLAAIGAWLGTFWWGTYQQAQSVQGEAASLESALRDGRWEAVPEQVDALTLAAGELSERTRQVPWRLLEGLPWIGSSASAVSILSQTLGGVGEAAEPLLPLGQRILEGEIRRQDGSIDVAAMQEASPLLERLTDQVELSIDRLEQVDAQAVRPEVGEPVERLRTELVDLLPVLRTASDVTVWLPGMLGADGPRDWLIMLQNPAEARGSGGFVGGYVIARTDEGRITLASRGTSSDLASEPIPAESAPADARETWGDALERWGAFNVSPHFPMTAALAADGMASRGEPVEGVIAVDPQGMASLLQVTGPVSADGKTITTEDAAQFFTVDIYREFPDSAERDQVTMDLVEATFRALLTAQWSPQTMADALRTPIEDDRIRAWSARADEQEWLEGSSLSGVLVDRPGSVVAVAFNNTARNKMDAFVRAEVDYDVGRCPTSETQQSQLQVTLSNDPPSDLPEDNYGYYADPDAPKGTTRMLVHLYVPVQSNYQFSSLDGEQVPLYLAEERNRPVWWTYVELLPGQRRVLDVFFDEPSVFGVEPELLVQPMVNDSVAVITEIREC